MRKAIGKIHLALSLLAGIFIVLISLTGSLLVFEHEIERLFQPKLYHVSAGPVVSYEQALTAAKKAHPKADVQRVYTPDEASTEGVYIFQMKDGKSSFSVYVDPGTGRINGEEGDQSFFTWVLELHRYLLLKDFNGAEITGIIGFLLFFITVSGIYLWWPGIRNWMRGFTFRRSPNTFAKHYNWHKVLGIWSVPFLLVVSLTGALFEYDEAIFGWFGAKPSKSPAKQILVSVPLPEGKKPLDALMRSAEQAVPDAKVIQVRMPAKPKKDQPEGAVEVRMTHGYDPGNGNARVWLDAYSGRVIAKLDAKVDSGLTYQTWLFPLHTGAFGGIVTKVLYAIGGLILPVLAVTGTYMWWFKRRKRKQKQDKTESQAA
ncbi:putative iron-regulated membrane protein [Aneurinibacillus soli]|uniref:Peptidase propeptide and YPEB domain protein n=1 Tax=Aneurinibacillus soli TaxID=1500254 RepID=A0A0U5B950_9BACL|nr:PepSY-associated TM helix domain-containing protein [Aneurinibacillus soli]PYE64153.1 putative iron-regulated membrane protein [Aneurinibacillus soli]BAU28102.1 Peptidase propeptide and YPEB domain protein [Aneurinibacillus soli]